MNVVVIADIAIIGGGLAACAAALAACAAGLDVVLTEATDWLGGQMTSQGVSALDEHQYIEDIPPTRAYAEMRGRIRQHYVTKYTVPPIMPNGSGEFVDKPLNPGNGWVSRLCFEPSVGVQVLQDMLAPHVASGRLKILLNHEPISAQVENEAVQQIMVRDATHLQSDRRGASHLTLRARYFLDATELGDLLPLTNTAFVIGAEAQSDTGEPHATKIANPNETQGFTYCFAVEQHEDENHIIEKPAHYERMRDAQPFTFTLYGHDGKPRDFRMWHNNNEQGLLPFWTYRRLIDANLLDPTGVHGLHDVAMINWPGNDYFGASLTSEVEFQILPHHEGKQLALAFLYWLQTEAPHDDGKGRGYPGLKLLLNIMGTADGLSKFPYIRESRRIMPLKRILEQHISSTHRSCAEVFADSVGIGWYSIDIHHCVGTDPKHPASTAFAPTHPFQIPLGALIPIKTRNLIAACKNIGTTHLTNGAYRLHPVEWAIGEAAGALAAFCCEKNIEPKAVYESPRETQALQERLRARGVNIEWPL